ncbi:MAG: ribonuclease III, partial [Chlorobiaceae bacterium]|nr:ribonuclease III [Chlorobiaceae bacterium]
MSLTFNRPEASEDQQGSSDVSGSTWLLEPETAHHLERLTGCPCNGQMIYLTALTHRSVLHDHNEEGEKPESNQRLEFLGDAVLDLLISEHLFRLFP